MATTGNRSRQQGQEVPEAQVCSLLPFPSDASSLPFLKAFAATSIIPTSSTFIITLILYYFVCLLVFVTAAFLSVVNGSIATAFHFFTVCEYLVCQCRSLLQIVYSSE